MANGVPGIELRLPLLFSEGVGGGRLSLNEFVALGATNHAKLYGLYPRKGTIALGGGRGPRALGPPAPGPRHGRPCSTTARLHPVRGPRAHGVAGHGDLPRAGRRPARAGSTPSPARGQFVPAAPSEWARPRGVAVPELARLRELGPALDL